jgi:hypothetical protein
VDLGFSGPKFTWNNRQFADDQVKVRLDRVVANGEFTSVFDDCNVENLITMPSDHLAIFINLSKLTEVTQRTPMQHSFRFEAAWLRAPDYREFLEKAWTEKACGDKLLQSTWYTLQQVAGSLQDWSREAFGAIHWKIQNKERQLKYLRMHVTDDALATIQQLEKELCELFEGEEIMARQRSCVEWLREGDRNTTFFHACASARKRANKIKSLQHDDGSRCTDHVGIKGMVQDFYGDLFTSEPTISTDVVLDDIPCKVSSEMNTDLLKE